MSSNLWVTENLWWMFILIGAPALIVAWWKSRQGNKSTPLTHENDPAERARPFIDERTIAMMRQVEHEWMMRAFHVGCPHCGRKLRELPPEANIYPHQTGACTKAEPTEESGK